MIHLLIYSPIYPCIHPRTHLTIHLSIYPASQPLTQQASHLPTCPFSHPVIYPFIYPVSQPSIHPLRHRYLFDKHTSPDFSHLLYIRVPRKKKKNESFRGSFHGPSSPQVYVSLSSR